jgi:hypothetical protein
MGERLYGNGVSGKKNTRDNMGIGFNIAVKRDGQYQAHRGDQGPKDSGSNTFNGNFNRFYKRQDNLFLRQG